MLHAHYCVMALGWLKKEERKKEKRKKEDKNFRLLTIPRLLLLRTADWGRFYNLLYASEH